MIFLKLRLMPLSSNKICIISSLIIIGFEVEICGMLD